MGIVIKVAQLVAKYGKAAVKWVWDNTGKVLDWAARGLSAYQIAEIIGNMFS